MKRYLHIANKKPKDSIRFIHPLSKEARSSSEFMQFNPITYEEETRQMFRQASDFELVEKFNGQALSSGWGCARAIYIRNLRQEFHRRPT